MKSRIMRDCLFGATGLALGFALARSNNAAPKNTNNAVPNDNGAKANEKPVNPEEAAIHKALAAYQAAYSKGDADALVECGP